MEREYGVIEVTHYRVIVRGQTHYYTKYIDIGDGYAKVMKNDKWGVLDNKGNRVCPLAYKYIGDLASGMMVIYDGYRYGYFSKETGTAWPCIFEMAYPFEGDTAKVIYEGKTRIVNKKGKFADKETGRFIECIFDSAEDFTNGTAKVMYKGEARTINTVGKFID